MEGTGRWRRMDARVLKSFLLMEDILDDWSAQILVRFVVRSVDCCQPTCAGGGDADVATNSLHCGGGSLGWRGRVVPI